MPLFLFTAKDNTGQTRVERLEADSEVDLVARLKDQGLYLISAQEIGQPKANGKLNLSFKFLSSWRGISRAEKMMAVRNLAVMIGAGLSLTRSLEALAEQTKSARFREILISLNESVSRGVNFADSLAKFPKEFDELFVSMIRVGETSGSLQECLIVLYRQMKKDHDLRSRVRGALIYPAVIVSAMVGIGIMMMIFVVPSLASTFADLKVDLPTTTKSIIWLSNNLSAVWPYLFAGCAALIFGFRYGIKTRPGKKIWHKFLIDVPLIGPVVKKVNSARFARTLSSLIESGLPIVRSLEITAGTLNNIFYKESIEKAADLMQKGGQLSSIVRQHPDLYQPMVVQMIAVGEETGALASLLKRIALFFESEVSNVTKNISSIIEPVLMIFIGAAVGFFAVSMMQPMYSLVGAM